MNLSRAIQVSLVVVFCATVCLMVTASTSAASVQAPVFTNASLKGAYGVLLNAWISTSNATNQASVGILNFDGIGNVTSSSFTVNTGGTITTDAATGTYSINKNGTGSIRLIDSQSLQLHLVLVINSTNKDLQLMQTNPDGTRVVIGTAVLQGSVSFTAASLKGAYGFLVAGSQDGNSPNPEGVLYLLSFDGISKLTAVYTKEDSGIVTTGTASGTYSVNSDGSGSFSLDNGTINFTLVVNSSGRSFQAIETACGCANDVQSGTATHQ